MYTVFAKNHVGTVDNEWNFLEYSLALQMFMVATDCIDCARAELMNAMTGELIMEFDFIDGIHTY